MSAKDEMHFLVTPVESGYALQDAASAFIADITNAAHSNELFGFDIDSSGFTEAPDGRLVPTPVVATAALLSLLSRTYIAGRGDQIADMEDIPSKRTVRARHLLGVIRSANTFMDPEEHIDQSQTIRFFAQYRGVLKNAVYLDIDGIPVDKVDSVPHLSDEQLVAQIVDAREPGIDEAVDGLPAADREIMISGQTVARDAIMDALTLGVEKIGQGESFLLSREQILELIAWAAHVGSESTAIHKVYADNTRGAVAGETAGALQHTNEIKPQDEKGEQ